MPVTDYAANKPWKQAKRLRIMQAAYRLFTQRGISPVTMPEIASAGQVSRATLYRYFPSKSELVIAVCAWKWEDYIDEYDASQPQEDASGLTGAKRLRLYLDAFLDLYRNEPEILRFNYDFNSYLLYENDALGHRGLYLSIVDRLSMRFHEIYECGRQDGTINTSIPEESMFSGLLHVMLAATTRYAVGLVYVSPNANPESELCMLEELLFAQYVREQ